jgi:ribosomal protein S27AE
VTAECPNRDAVTIQHLAAARTAQHLAGVLAAQHLPRWSCHRCAFCTFHTDPGVRTERLSAQSPRNPGCAPANWGDSQGHLLSKPVQPIAKMWKPPHASPRRRCQALRASPQHEHLQLEGLNAQQLQGSRDRQQAARPDKELRLQALQYYKQREATGIRSVRLSCDASACPGARAGHRRRQGCGADATGDRHARNHGELAPRHSHPCEQAQQRLAQGSTRV